MFNMFEEVKQHLKPTQVVKFYIGEGQYKAGAYWYVSPFRREKTASFCANDKKGIHDFGDNTHYDIVSFTSKLFNLSNTDTIKKLIQDFDLPIKFGDRKPKIFYQRDVITFKKELAKRELEKKEKETFYNNIYTICCDNFKDWNKFIAKLQENRSILKSIDLSRVYARRDYLEWLVDELFESSVEDIWENKEFWKEMII